MIAELHDLHMHLNGSFSLGFLEKTAAIHACPEKFVELTQLSIGGTDEESIALIWEKFSLIHQIVQSLEDIKAGTIDVVNHSSADYLEIRTRAKSVNNSSWHEYVDAFVSGLSEVKKLSNKQAFGLLSLDRTIHTVKDAYDVIDRVASEKKSSGLLVGIDISGNPLTKRSLTGGALSSALLYALNKNIGVAIHIGEVDTSLEKDEIDGILKTLSSQDISFQGKVRLGHGIFLTAQQRKLIKTLQIPIEICPSCHEKMNWWGESKTHPITEIYTHWKDPVVFGTDDEIIFGGNAKQESQALFKMLGGGNCKDYEDSLKHHGSFRFQ